MQMHGEMIQSVTLKVRMAGRPIRRDGSYERRSFEGFFFLVAFPHPLDIYNKSTSLLCFVNISKVFQLVLIVAYEGV